MEAEWKMHGHEGRTKTYQLGIINTDIELEAIAQG